MLSELVSDLNSVFFGGLCGFSGEQLDEAFHCCRRPIVGHLFVPVPVLGEVQLSSSSLAIKGAWESVYCSNWVVCLVMLGTLFVLV